MTRQRINTLVCLGQGDYAAKSYLIEKGTLQECCLIRIQLNLKFLFPCPKKMVVS